MDDALAPGIKKSSGRRSKVLILVVMDDALARTLMMALVMI